MERISGKLKLKGSLFVFGDFLICFCGFNFNADLERTFDFFYLISLTLNVSQAFCHDTINEIINLPLSEKSILSYKIFYLLHSEKVKITTIHKNGS
jgi:hypothetical protein